MDVRIEREPFHALSGKALAERMRGEEVFITDEDKVNEETLDGNKNLKIIGTPLAGLDHIDLEAATKRGIPVVHTPGANADAVAEFVFGLILASSKRILMADARLRRGMKHELESYRPLMGFDLKDKTIGVVGVGNIGSRVAMIAKGFRMNVVLYDPTILPTRLEQFGKVVELDELLQVSDFVTVHVPLTRETTGMFGVQQFRSMKTSALFVNTSRGKVVNESDLVEVLRERGIAGAALDVQAIEPLPANSPLLTLDNVIVTPHIGSFTIETQTYCQSLVEEEVIRFVKGQRLRFVANPKALAKQT
jgi:phosphoglycerate dehydrogenase-like enzyme